MKRTSFVAGLMAAALFAAPAWAEIMVKDPYVRTSTPSSVTGAAFMMLMNTGDTDDRLVSATSSVAGRVELHTHIEDENGVMKMTEVEEGFVVPAGATYPLKRGGDHVMLMGLTEPLEQGAEITITLTFENAGAVEVQVPVDRERKPDHGSMDHSHMDHSSDS